MSFCPRLLDGHRAAVGDVGAVDRLVVDEELPGHGVQAVGGDHDGGLLDMAVLERHRRTAGGVLVAHGLLVVDEVDAGALAGAKEDAVQVAAVDDHVGEAVRALEVAQVETRQLGPVDGVLHDHGVGDDPKLLGLVQQPVLVEDARAVGGDLQSCADLAELRRALQQAHVQSLASQREGRAQAADATADDEDVGGRFWSVVVMLLLRCVGVRARRAGRGGLPSGVATPSAPRPAR